MSRGTWLLVSQQHDLNQACRPIWEAFGGSVYLVGSVLARRDYKDVDVRCILPDEEFDRLFPGETFHPLRNTAWSLFNAAISEWLAARTGLPIDFQFQRLSNANAEFDGPRNPLGMFMRPGGGE